MAKNIINDVVLNLFTKQGSEDHDIFTVISMLRSFLGPLPLLPSTKMPGFSFGESLGPCLLDLKFVLDASASSSGKNHRDVLEKLDTIQKSKHALFQNFNSLTVGRRVLAELKTQCGKQASTHVVVGVAAGVVVIVGGSISSSSSSSTANQRAGGEPPSGSTPRVLPARTGEHGHADEFAPRIDESRQRCHL